MVLERFEQLIKPEMALLDEELANLLGTEHPFLAEMAQRILAAPGKRLRPKLLVLCARMLGYHEPDVVVYAAIFELIHTATLIHDDIIDEAKTRRGLPTLNAKHGNTITVLYGDLLYTKSHTRAVETGRLDVLHTIDWISERMIEGELLQNKHAYDVKIDEATYFDILCRKTAYLFAGTTKTAGLIANRPEDEVQALFDFGFQLGIAFQLMDDYLDYTGVSGDMGKPVLNDLIEGKVTLPLIRLLKDGDPTVTELVERCWREQAVPPELLARMETSQVLEETFAEAEAASKKAIGHLERFPNNPYSEILTGLPLFLLSRRK